MGPLPFLSRKSHQVGVNPWNRLVLPEELVSPPSPLLPLSSLLFLLLHSQEASVWGALQETSIYAKRCAGCPYSFRAFLIFASFPFRGVFMGHSEFAFLIRLYLDTSSSVATQYTYSWSNFVPLPCSIMALIAIQTVTGSKGNFEQHSIPWPDWLSSCLFALKCYICLSRVHVTQPPPWIFTSGSGVKKWCW